MLIQNTSRRLRPQILSQDIDALNGLRAIFNYQTTRQEATAEAVQAAYQMMLLKQQAEIEKQALYKAAADAARLAEWEFHNSVLAMKEAVRGQFGVNSNEAQAIGLKKKSNYKRPSRSKSIAAAS